MMKDIPNVIENLDLRASQSPGIGRSNLATISNRGDDSIAPIAGAFASVLNQIFSHVGYNQIFNHVGHKEIFWISVSKDSERVG